MEKSIIRVKMHEIRSKMLDADVNMKSNEITNKLMSLDLSCYKNFLVYSNFNNEVKTGHMIEYLIKNNKFVYLPVCNTEKNEFSVSKIESSDFKYKINKYGIKEPHALEFQNTIIDCALIPGIAFDTNGNRIGFGGGYYDKFLSGKNEIFKIGLCYDFQITDKIDINSADIAMDIVITEERIINHTDFQTH